ncbi:hypothetical protein ABT294_29365 [Nonomuraea sp. NPDC000554]|uniref:hypothetical protein n=1 Tax=Nonomuraea sp. NPDC000554 TaxID=3154259 RepID=UPI003327096F
MASKVVVLTGVGIVSLLVVGPCAAHEEVGADCVDLASSRLLDGSYLVVDDDNCDDPRYGGSHGAYDWYYGGTRIGPRVARGTAVRPADVMIVSRSGTVIQRGGFGGRGSGGG